MNSRRQAHRPSIPRPIEDEDTLSLVPTEQDINDSRAFVRKLFTEHFRTRAEHPSAETQHSPPRG